MSDLVYGLGANGGEPFSGTLVGFQLVDPGDTGDCELAVSSAPWLSGFTGFHAYYRREL